MGVLTSLLSNRGYILVNKSLARLYGLDEAVLLGELAAEFEYWETQDELDDGYFYSTVENVEENTTLTDHQQRKAIKTLKGAGVLNIKVKGVPPKRFFSISDSAIFEDLNLEKVKNQSLKKLRIESEKSEESNLKKLRTNNNKEKNNNKSNNSPLTPQRGDAGRKLTKSKVIKMPPSEDFEKFWKAYPRRDGKQEAWWAWYKAGIDSDLTDKIIAHVSRRRNLWEWKQEGGQYIPHASAFINQRRWEDDLTGKPTSDPKQKNALVGYAQHTDSGFSIDDIALNLDGEDG